MEGMHVFAFIILFPAVGPSILACLSCSLLNKFQKMPVDQFKITVCHNQEGRGHERM